ncbi:MAG TPA: DUF4157 domain-containing protein [Gemmatimonadales bacterium]|nr:DUF4157 domain-containing protein [Gemmatimonadales bacterium]
MHRRVARPLAAVGGPVVGGVLSLLCRLLNGGRARALTATERAALEPLVPEAPLDAIRVVEDAALPIAPGFGAITLGRTIYVRGGLLARMPGLLAHEAAHVAQFERLGWHGMMTAYGALWLEHGYRAHPLEREARDAERAALARWAARRAADDHG